VSGRARRALVLAFAAAAALGQTCVPPNVRIEKPLDGALFDEPSLAASIAIPRVGFDLLSGTVRFDGVDLILALGLAPPFSGASGVVVVGSQTVAITGFTYEVPPTGPASIALSLAGVELGEHLLEAQAERTSGVLATRSARFDVVEPFTREAEVVAAAGQPQGLLGSILGARLASSTLGEGIAGPPVPMAGGGSLREGFPSVARARALGAP
jgi:hypothetical protein